MVGGDILITALTWFGVGAAIGFFVALVWKVACCLCGLDAGGGGGGGGSGGGGLGTPEIEAIPVHVYGASEDAGERGGGFGTDGAVEEGPPRREDDGECPVCLGDFVPGDELCRLPCTHSYHKGCVRPWLRKVASCPMCMSQVVVQVAQ